MTPLEFLNLEFENVQLTLRETLRHDYFPQQSEEYYRECEARLAGIDLGIKTLTDADTTKIAGYLNSLSTLTTFVSLIERSRLGEFSWPFAEELRRISKVVLAEKDLRGNKVEPIIGIISEGQGYRIVYEPQVSALHNERRFLVVAFPRSLKHHVLLHTLFGHEVGHTALYTTEAGKFLHGEVFAVLTATSPLKDVAAMNVWVRKADADPRVKNDLANFPVRNGGQQFQFTESNREKWLVELVCDLVGIVLFGPAFFAAHYAYLRPLHPLPYDILEATHPAFAIRHKMLVQVMKVMGWDKPITTAADGPFHEAEKQFLDTILKDPYTSWAQFFTDAEVQLAVTGVKKIFQPQPRIAYEPLPARTFGLLIDRLTKGHPPIIATIDALGKPELEKIHISQTLHAGWVYWMGREKLKANAGYVPLGFLNTNKLCDQALLQQRAIDLTLDAGVP